MSKEHSTRFKKLPFPLRATSAFLSAVMLFTPMGASARNLPTGAQIVRGQVVINTTGKVMDVNQQSSKAIVNWQSFDIGHGYEVNVNQPSARAAMLARVIGANPSEIYGKLTANGRLYLVNPNGILFGSGAQIDVNRLIASTLNISDDNFWNGNLVFEGNSDAAVKNLGTINAESAALIARHVDNAGAINANQIGLVGASSKVTLDNFGNGGKLSIDFSALNAGEARSASVANRGVLDAGDDGEVIISAEGGRGKIDVSQGVVRTGHAEFSGYNASIFSLGDVRARTVLIDPEESLVIGKDRISGTTYTDSLGRQYTSWSDRDQSDPFPNLDSVGDDAGTYEVYMFNEGGKPEGNGYRYTKTVRYAPVPTVDGSGGQVIKFRRIVEYDAGIETYIASQNLTDALHGDKVGHFALNYTKGADAGSDFGRIRVDSDVVVGGKSGLTLDAQNNLTVAGGFDFNNVGRLELLTGSELDAGDAVINAAGSVKVKAGVASNLQELNAVGEIKIVSDKGISIEKLTSLGDIVISGEGGNLLVGIIKGRDINVANLANSGTDALESITASGNLTVEVGSNLAVGNSQITGNADISAVTATIDSLAAQNIAVTADEATISGVNAATGDITFQARTASADAKVLEATGQITAGGRFVADGHDLRIIDGDLELKTQGGVSLKSVVNDGQKATIDGGIGNVTVARAVGGTESAETVIRAGGDIAVQSVDDEGELLKLAAGGDVTVNGKYSTVASDVDVVAGNNVRINGEVVSQQGHVGIAADTGDVRLNGGITAGKDVDVNAGRDVFGDAAANIAAGNGGITVAAGRDIGLEGSQQAKAITNLAGNDLKVGGAVTATEGDATLTAGNNLQADGDITASEGVALMAREGSVKAGKIKAGDEANAWVHGAIDTTINGTVEGKDVTISAGTGDVRLNGGITAGKDVEVIAGRDVFGDAAANIAADNGSITVAAGRDIGLEGSQQAKAIANHAGNDLKVGGAVTAAEGDATLTAGNDARVDGAITVADADSSAVVMAGRNAVVAGAVNSKGVATINATQGAIEVSGALEGAEGVILAADKDILVRSAVASTDGSITMNSGVGKVEVLNVVKGGEIAPSTLNAKYDIFVDAKRDITLEGAQVSTEGGIKVISQSGDVKVADQTALWVWDMAREGSVNAANIDVIDGINIDAAKNITVDGNLKAENFNIMVGRWQDDEFGAPATMGDIVIRGTQEAGRQIFNWTEGGSITLGKAGDGISGKATSGGSIDLVAKGDITVEMGGLEVTGGNNAVAPSINVSTTDGDISIRGVQDARAIGGEDGEGGRITYQADSGSISLYSAAFAFGGVSVEAGKDITTLDLASRDANIDVTSKQGDINVRGRQYAKSGDITNTAEAGDVILETAALANGTIIIEGGNVTTKALTSEEGDIIVNALDGDLLIDGTQSAKGGFMGVQNTATGSVTTRSIKSGLAISVDAQEGSATVTGDIINEGDDAHGVSITAREDVSVIGDVKGDSGITMTAKTGNLEYQMADADADGVWGKDQIEFTAGQDLSINGNVASVEGGVQITAGRDATVEGGIVVEGEGSQIRLEAGRNAEIGASQRAAATDGMVINQAGNNLDIRGEVQADAAFMTAEHGDITVSSEITTASTSFFENLRIHAGHDVRLRSNSVLDAGKGNMVIAADTGVVAAQVSDAGARRPKLVGDSVSITGQAGVDLENAVVGRGGENETELTTRVNITANTGDVITGDTTAKYVLVTARTGGIENRGRIKATDILRLDAHLDVDLGAVEGGSLETIVENGDIDIAQAIEMESIFLETKNGNVTSTTAGTLTATEKNVTVAAGKDVGLKGAVTAEKGDISIAAGRDARIAGEQNAAGKAEYIAGRNLTTGDGAAVTADTISMTSQGGNLEIGADLTAKGDGIQVMAEAGNVEVNGRQTAENGAIVNEAAVNLAISGPVKAQVVKLAAANGDVKISGDDTTIEATDEINGKIMVTAGHDLEITGGKNTATGAAEYTAGRNLTIDGNAAVEAASITMSAKNGNASISKSLEATDGDIVVNALNGDVAIHDIQTANKGSVVNVAGNNLFVSDKITARDLVAVQAMDGSASVDAIEVGEEGAASVFAGMDAKLRGEVIAREVYVLAEHGDITADMAITARNGGIIAEAGRDAKVTGTQSAANGAVSNTARNNLTVEGEIIAGDNITLQATEGNLELSANATSAEGVISAEAGRDAKVTGTQSAANGAVSNTARENLTVEGEITARDNITLQATEGNLELSANATSNDGVITAEAGRDADISGEQKATSGSVINHAANDLAVTGGITAGDAAQLTAQDGQIQLGAAVDARNDITIEARRGDVAISEDGDLVSADGDIAVTAGRDARIDGNQTAENGAVSNTARENLVVGGEQVIAGEGITLRADNGDLQVSTGEMTATAGDILASTGKGNVRIRNGEGDGEQPVAVTAQAGNVQIISGDGIDIGAKASVRAVKNVGLTARNDIGNSGSVIGRNDVMISSDSGDITNSGVVAARNNLKVKTLSGDVNNAAQAAMMTANGEIEIDAHGDVYNNGQISAAGDEGAVSIKATGDVENDAQGDIYARKLVRIKANGDTTNSGSITAYDITDGEGQIVIESDGDVHNKDTGRMHADIKAEITSGDGDIDNSGLIQAGDTDPLTPGSEIVLNALKGDINSDGSLIAETVTLNARGKIDVQGDTDADHVFAHTTGVGGNIDLKLDHDVKGLSATTEGAQSDITVRARNIGNGQLVAKGEDSDIAINGLDMTLTRVTAEDGNVDISGGNLRLGTVYAHEDGTPILNGEAGDARNVRVNAAGNVYIGNTVEADANVAINASGAITGSPLASVNAGNDIDLTSGDHIGEAGNALEVNAGGDLFVNAQPGTPEREYFAFIRGTSGDGEVHSKSKKLPGLVIFNSVAWMGTAKQMSRIDRAYAHMFNLLNKELWLVDQAWPLESAYRYFPHTALYNDGYGEDLRRGYERIRLDAPAVRVNGLPEGISVEGAQNAEDTFIWNFGPQAAK